MIEKEFREKLFIAHVKILEAKAEMLKIKKEFINNNSPVKKFLVYEIISNKKRFEFKRFVVYEQSLKTVSEQCENDLNKYYINIIIEAKGYWLDSNDIPKQLDTLRVYCTMGKRGKDTVSILKLSDNQTHKIHPDYD